MVKKLVDTVIVTPAQRIGPVKRLVNYVAAGTSESGYHHLRSRFIANGRDSKWSESLRAEVIRRFEIIDRKIRIASTPAEGLIMAEAILSMDAEGDVVECGCYAGGSTAKLSIVAKVVGKSLHVFDSFEGLPKVDDNNLKDFNARMGSEWVTDWTAGRYSTALEQVRANVQVHGEVSVCSFHKGWFSETLTPANLPEKVACSFTDVDIPSSARECLAGLWPRISDGGVFFLHDIGFIKLLQTVLDEDLWTNQFKSFPPILFGAGYGLGDASPYLGFFVKGKRATAEYINRLTIDK